MGFIEAKPDSTNVLRGVAAYLAAYERASGSSVYPTPANPAQEKTMIFRSNISSSAGTRGTKRTAYLCPDSFQGMRVVDASNEKAPKEIGHLLSRAGAVRSGYGGTAYLAGWTDGLQVIDIANPASLCE